MTGAAPSDPAPAGGRGAPIDPLALLAIAIAIVATHVPYLRSGMCWNEPSRLFHLGHRVLAGDTPFADFVHHGGPLPIYVDAAFQAIFGGTYRASLDAALAITILRVFVIWLIARRLAGLRAAAAVAAFCAIDPVFAYAHHGSTAYVQLFVSLAGLFVLLAARAEGRRGEVHQALAGLSIALVAWARPSVGLMLGVAALALAAILVRRGELAPRRLAALGAGYAAGLALLAAVLLAAGALGPAIDQVILDPSRRDAFGLESALDAWQGGAPLDLTLTWWGAALASFALPAAVVAGMLHLLAREREVSPQALAALAVPVGIAFGISTRYASLSLVSDLPRLVLLAVAALAVAAPERSRRWLGLEPIVAFGLAALPLAADRAYPGAAWSETSIHAIGALLIVLATARVPARAKALACLALALAAALHFTVARRHHHPFAHPLAEDGSPGQNRERATARGARHPLLVGQRIGAPRARVLEWLASEIAPGSTCFIHGDLPALYTLLGCANPARVDTTAASLITPADAAAASAALRAAPPEHLLVHEQRRLAEGIDLGLAGYEPVSSGREILGEELAKRAAAAWDGLDTLRLYRRRAAPAGGTLVPAGAARATR